MSRRGASYNPPNRFEKIRTERDEPEPLPRTQFLRDASKSIISYNDSPDLGFRASINPYRGCEHGCAYCFARPTHEYLGFSAGLDFESKIMVKYDAPRLLREELSKPSWEPQVVAISGVTDPYQPIERKLEITRGCLKVLAEFRNPAAIVTKNALVTRDTDLLAELAKVKAAAVNVSVTTMDAALAGIMEPRTSTPSLRLEAIAKLSEAGIPVNVLVAPVIPAINDHELPRVIEAAAKAGARSAGYVVLRLPYALKEIFEAWLARYFPDRKDKVLNRLRELRGGKLYDAAWGQRQLGQGEWAKQIAALFAAACRRAGLKGDRPELSTAAFRRPPGPQLELFSQ